MATLAEIRAKLRLKHQNLQVKAAVTTQYTHIGTLEKTLKQCLDFFQILIQTTHFSGLKEQ
tara:strand:+ start:867 stop:1049 length:183 start_codon:yes stop_codon:yes gene_type:complete